MGIYRRIGSGVAPCHVSLVTCLVQHGRVSVHVTRDKNGRVAALHRGAVKDRHAMFIKLKPCRVKPESLKGRRTACRDENAVERALAARGTGPRQLHATIEFFDIQVDAKMERKLLPDDVDNCGLHV